jgi:glycosyltransferase involved in cell wall biosynthesis
VIIFHWPTEFMKQRTGFADAKHLLKLAVAKLFGARLIWVAHNLRAHDEPVPQGLGYRTFLSFLDGVIYLSRRSRSLVRSNHRLSAHVRELVTVHGCYEAKHRAAPPFSPPAPGDAVVLVNFGQIKPYKNLESLVAAASSLGAHEAVLSIAGHVRDVSLAQRLASSRRENIVLDLRDEPLADEELERLVDRADAVVLPYKDILNSGAAIFALCRNRPVIVPSVGSMPELQEQVGREWVYLYTGELTPKLLRDALSWVRTMPRSTAPPLEAFRWSTIGRDLQAFVLEVSRAGGRRQRAAVGDSVPL